MPHESLRRTHGRFRFSCYAAFFSFGLFLSTGGCTRCGNEAMSVTGTPYPDLPFSEGPALDVYTYDEYDRINEDRPAYFTVWNLKQAPLLIEGIFMSGKDAADFRPLLHHGKEVPVGDNRNFTIVFTPSGLGPREAEVEVRSADPNDVPFRFRLSYRGSRGATSAADTVGGEVRPVLIDAGSEYALAWKEANGDHSSLFFLRLGRDGRPLAPRTLVATSPVGEGGAVSFVRTDNGYGVVWEDVTPGTSCLMLALLDVSGRAVGGVKTIVAGRTEKPSHPCLVWNGNGFGLAYLADKGTRRLLTSPRPPFFTSVEKPNRDLYVMLLDASGDAIGNAVRVRSDSGGPPSLVRDGEGYALAWADTAHADDAAFFMRLSPDGNPAGGPLRLSPENSEAHDPVLVRGSDDFGAAWIGRSFTKTADERNYSLSFARIDAAGVVVGEAIVVFSSFARRGADACGRFAVHAHGGDFAVTGFLKSEHRITTAIVNRSGRTVGDNEIHPGYPGVNHSIIFGPRGMAVAWHYQENGAGRIYFAAVDR